MFEECLYFNSNALARTVSRIWTEAYRQFDLSPPHAFLLRVVLAKPGLLPRELAEELSLSRSTVTRFLDSLEKRDLLIRRPTGKDGRELQVYPTKAAKAMHQALDDTGGRLTKLMGEIIGKNDVSTTVAKLREIQKSLESV
ncbi:MAG: MarR family transcriptional regulator [Chromatiales bacterium]|nr:MarR family transcriptional regulator [Chromatiales bacterium]